MSTPIEVLCRQYAPEFASYLSYIRSLRFDDKPDYAYLRRLMRDLFYKKGYQTDWIFDWTITDPHQLDLRERQRRHDEEKARRLEEERQKLMMKATRDSTVTGASSLQTPTGIGMAVSSVGIPSHESSMRAMYDPSQSMRSMGGVSSVSNGGGMMANTGGIISSSAMIANASGGMSNIASSPTGSRRPGTVSGPSSIQPVNISHSPSLSSPIHSQQLPASSGSAAAARQSSSSSSFQRRSTTTSSRRSRPEEELLQQQQQQQQLQPQQSSQQRSSINSGVQQVDEAFQRLATDRQLGSGQSPSPTYGTRLTKTAGK